MIRQWLAKEVSQQVADETRILYGGSVSEKNCKELSKEHQPSKSDDTRIAALEKEIAKLNKDIEKLREHLGVEKWHVFGGSWVSLQPDDLREC